jgi:hypothetical protein
MALLSLTVARDAQAVTKSDTTVYSPPLNGVWVGGTGDVAILTPNNPTPVVFSAVPAGTLLPVQALKVMATATTATLLAGFK